jgi:LacI family transcriptional regulator
VSGVLNNTHDAAGPEMRERILEMIEQMNYSPSAVARGLSRRRMNTLGVVMQYDWGTVIADQHVGPIFDGIVTRNTTMKQKTLLYPEPWSKAMANLPSFCDGFCDGILLIVPMVPTEFFERLIRRRLPFVIIGDSRTEENYTVVDVDNVDAGRQITSHLIELGHRRIAMLRGNDDHCSSVLRAQGYKESLQTARVQYDPSLDIHCGYTSSTGYQHTAALMDRPLSQRPTALFCGDDRIAFGALDALADRGIRVPEDISVVGINDSIEGAAMPVPLTSFQQPGRLIGNRSVDMLIFQITGEEQPGRKVAIPGKLIIRRTSGPVP